MRKKTLKIAALVFSVTFIGMISCGAKTMYTVSATISESKAECVMELHSRRILYESNADIRLPMASTTKIATAATVLALCDDLEQKITIPREAEGVEGSSVYLKSGEEYTVRELLYGLMLRSGNDCATALALHISDSVSAFTARMNEFALSAGATTTNFRNPHGLPCQNHYTTAKDLTLIACAAMQNPTFCEIVSTRYFQPRHWKNKNKMLTEYGGIGVKTGYTKEAGRCLVSAMEKEGMTLICSVLSSPNMYERSAALLNDAFRAYRLVPLLSKEETFTATIDGKAYSVHTKEDFVYPLCEGEEKWIETQILPVEKKNPEGILGQIQITLAKRLLFSANLYKL